MSERGRDPALTRHEDAIQDIVCNGALQVPVLRGILNDYGAYI